MKHNNIPVYASFIYFCSHIVLFHSLVLRFDYGYIGGAMALSITYFINLVILYVVAYLKRDI